MTGYVLVIEEKPRIEPLLLRVLSDTLFSTVSLNSITAAKRKLVESAPILVAADVNLGSEIGAGFKLARELSEHQSLAKIPLFLFSDKLSEEVIREATSSGAKALIPWPISQEALRQRLAALIGGPSESAPSLVETTPAKTEASRTGPKTALAPEVRVAVEDPNTEKLQLAQQILAKVLHNLKTSALLDVVDLEDVPQVVGEITKAVCAQMGSVATTPAQAVTLESALRGKK